MLYSNRCKMFCFFARPLLRFSSLRLSPAPRSLCSPTPAQQTTRTTRPPRRSRSPRRPWPAFLCGNNPWKRERKERKRGRKRGMRCQQRRGWSWWSSGRPVAARRPRVRARRARYAARARAPTRSTRTDGPETCAPFKLEEASAAATNPGPLI